MEVFLIAVPRTLWVKMRPGLAAPADLRDKERPNLDSTSKIRAGLKFRDVSEMN